MLSPQFLFLRTSSFKSSLYRRFPGNLIVAPGKSLSTLATSRKSVPKAFTPFVTSKSSISTIKKEIPLNISSNPISKSIITNTYLIFHKDFSTSNYRPANITYNTTGIWFHSVGMSFTNRFSKMNKSRAYSSPAKPSQKSDQKISPSKDSNQKESPSKPPSIFSRYGRIAIFLYFVISTIDLPLSILLVYFSGDKFTDQAIDLISKYFPSLVSDLPHSGEPSSDKTSFFSFLDPKTTVILIVGYAIHKLLLPIRLSVTAALSPKLAKMAAKNGWTFLLSNPKTPRKP
ncbi:N-terminal acetyltransferase 2 [Smittium mucronatum]|uniref:N-terminal acetyltransferase 2 n=1 Tax=Smittium mucronatum TaxID=133383 RepID=A0A1R0H0L7_9FUNG|nr:N-terminal acetyltransferase 2 [Smittium mucronatum]